MLRLGLAVGLALSLATLASPGGPPEARAHASLERADPPIDGHVDASPRRLRLWFTEPLEPDFSAVELRGADGSPLLGVTSRVAPGDPRSLLVDLPTLAPGQFVVAWQALSSLDGHGTRGTYSLAVGDAAPLRSTTLPPEISAGTGWEALARWLAVLGLALVLGGLVFRALVLLPATTRLGLAAALGPADRRLGRLVAVGWAVGVAGLVGQLALALAAAGGGMGQLLVASRLGRLWLARLALVLLLGVALRVGRRRGWAVAADPALWLAVALAALAALNSHAAAVTPGTGLAILADAVHVLAVTAWLGGLAALLWLLPAALGSLPEGDRQRLLATCLARFSSLAIAAVLVIVLTGAWLAYLHVGAPAALLHTAYGLGLAAKLALVLPLLALGAFNLLVVRRRVATTEPAGSERQLRRSVRLELGLAVLVLLAAGWVASLPPARSSYAEQLAREPLELTGEAADLQVGLAVGQPASAAPATVTLRRSDGRPVEETERVDLRFTYLDAELGTRSAQAAPAGAGRYVVSGPYVGLDGAWQAEVTVRRAGQDDARTAFRFQVLGGAAEAMGGGAAGAAGELPALPDLPLAPLGVVAVLLAMAWVLRDARRRARPGGALVGLPVAVLVLGVAALFGVGLWLSARPPAPPPGPDAAQAERRNPFVPDEASLTIGRRIYEARCVVCHGPAGRGDGPAAAGLDPPPADFRVHMAAGHTDGQLFGWLSDGVGGTAMPAFRDSLTEAERWHVINHLRTFAGS